MATLSKPVGYEYEFVDQVPEDYFCKLCKHVAREPTIASCCTEILCKACIDAIVQDKKPCPSCESNDIKALGLQVKYQRKILALEVRCTMKDRRCPWTGQLQHLDAHLDVTTGDCLYVDLECPNKCDQKVQKRNVSTHLVNECPNRDYRCPHCNFTDTYQVVTEQHWEVCSYYPLACQNRCGVTFERGDLEDHMKMCPLEEVQCVFSSEGCQAKFIRDNEDDHMDQNTQKHIALMPAATLRISQDFERKLQKQQKVFERRSRRIAFMILAVIIHLYLSHNKLQLSGTNQLQMRIEELESSVQHLQQVLGEKLEQELKKQSKEIQSQRDMLTILQQENKELYFHTGLLPYYITLSNYQKKKNIVSSMYTHPEGYRFKLKLFPNGANHGAGSEVSVAVYSLISDHDDELKFPAKFTITLQLLNQHRDQDHHTRDIQCEIKTRGDIGSGVPIGNDWTFIPHADLKLNHEKHTKYLKDDQLKFRITKIVLQKESSWF